jgi:hypothetical protein
LASSSLLLSFEIEPASISPQLPSFDELMFSYSSSIRRKIFF